MCESDCDMPKVNFVADSHDCGLTKAQICKEPAYKVLTRRRFLRDTTMATFGFLGFGVMATDADWLKAQLQYFQGKDVLARILQKSSAAKWRKLPMGEVMGKVAMELAGTPWRPSTLDVSEDAEFCVVNLKAVDCFTFIENSLC